MDSPHVVVIPEMDSPHVVVIPLMSKGHTIPLVDLAHLLLLRRLASAVTFLTTPRNAPFLRRSLVGTPADVLVLPFPCPEVTGLPAHVESTDTLPSMSLFVTFASATALLRPAVHSARASLRPPASIIVSDGFLTWTADVAASLRIPRLTFFGTGMFSTAANIAAVIARPFASGTPATSPVTLPGFPGHQFTRADFDEPFGDPDGQSPFHDLAMSCAIATASSAGLIVNSFRELDGHYAHPDMKPKPYFIGPLCLADNGHRQHLADDVRSWLDSKLASRSPVLYVAFGTQCELSDAQMEELRCGLCESGVDFLWVVRSRSAEEGTWMEEVAEGRGVVVRGWVEQREVLRHESVKAFASHCGWNSVMEAASAGVAVAAWPMGADQPLNAKLVVEELGIGVWMGDSSGELVGRERVAKAAREVVEAGKVRRAAEETAGKARRASEDGGPSLVELEAMVREVVEKA